MKVKIPKCEICETTWFDNFLDGDKKELEAEAESIRETNKCISCYEEFDNL